MDDLRVAAGGLGLAGFMLAVCLTKCGGDVPEGPEARRQIIDDALSGLEAADEQEPPPEVIRMREAARRHLEELLAS